MFRVALFLSVFAFILSCPVVMAESESSSSDQPETAQTCPKSPLEASQVAAKDVQKFKKMYYSGTWTGFLHQFRLKYAACPENIKSVYVESARQLMNPSSSQVGSFQNSLKK
jgi:hypothetical protein